MHFSKINRLEGICSYEIHNTNCAENIDIGEFHPVMDSKD